MNLSRVEFLSITNSFSWTPCLKFDASTLIINTFWFLEFFVDKSPDERVDCDCEFESCTGGQRLELVDVREGVTVEAQVSHVSLPVIVQEKVTSVI